MAELPTLSKMRSYTSTHLSEAAVHWDTAAEQWRGVYNTVHFEAQGLEWEGLAREAAMQRIADDHAVVKSNADALAEAASIARNEASTLDTMARSVTHLADQVQENGYTVADDYEVDFPRTANVAEYIERHLQAEKYSADLRFRAGNFMAHEHKTAGDLIQAVDEHRTIHATPYPGGLMDRDRENPLPQPPGQAAPGKAWHVSRSPYGDDFAPHKKLEQCEPSREVEDITKATLGVVGIASGNPILGTIGATLGVEGSLKDLFKCEPPEGVH